MMRMLRWSILAALAALLLLRGVAPALTSIASDFPNYYTAAHLVLHRVDASKIYDNAWFGAEAAALGLNPQSRFIPWPPATAFLLLPFAGLPPLLALRAWTLLNLAALCLLVSLLRSVTGRPIEWCALLTLAAGHALINNFRLGQAYILLTICVLLIYRGMERDRAAAAGVALGAGTAIKYFPALYVVALVGRKQWRTVAWAAATFGVVVAAGYLVVGGAANADFIAHIVLPHLQGDIVDQSAYATAFQSWNVLLRQLFVSDGAENPAPVLAWPAGYVIGLAAVYALASAIVWRAWRATDRLELRFATLTFAALAVLPASATYHYLLAIPPTAVVLALPGRWSGPQRVIAVCYVAIGFLPYGLLLKLGGHGASAPLAFPRLWLSCAMFFASARLCLQPRTLPGSGRTNAAGRRRCEDERVAPPA